MESIITDIDKYISVTEDRIALAKSKEKKLTGDLLVKFRTDGMASYFKKHFEQRGYSIELRKCGQCKAWDIIISW